MASVAAQLAKIAKSSEQKMETVIKKSLIRLGSMIVNESPVDTGRFKNNWLSAYGAADTSTTESTDISGGASIGALTAKLNGIIVGDAFYFTNSLPYAQRIEYLGWSEQAKQGVVRVSVASWQSITDEEIRKAR